MTTLTTFQDYLSGLLTQFDDLVDTYDHTMTYSPELERLLDEYSTFITDEANKNVWEQLIHEDNNELNQLVVKLRKQSARCVAIMEKYRALKLLNHHESMTDYFKNIESSIESEFGSFHVTSKSKVLLVGSGSFPMTLLLIAKRTGADVIGIDIDDEAVQLGRKVVEKLGKGLNVRLEQSPVENIDTLKAVTHVIFSSTVEQKYDLLDHLHPLTHKDVVVAMRYGDQLKSLFNYPSREVDEQKWRKVNAIVRPEHVFDIILYQKA
ncbi:methyltransferase domain-containing protein [Salipaludibacillus sp. LMS25]|jgi:2-polyprenyl-3-methyl-5-hydroxy-6-metoxy-1,4-benzoquinol methylase|uniref:nicotianamine synthase family protein n=1 Tax=Salipaludibacillus sp. LMS25 TaxID=2924031 RepID=UPI0020CFF194|nr:nicotianamine synthase family protein [Salipaludibacillus sp. LMS25]UTR16864.1 methyltransferase domain-containing protein [Salipaludibacillus sp. LMS25]